MDLKNKMISFLSENYPDDLQMRGLWLCREGDPQDIRNL